MDAKRILVLAPTAADAARFRDAADKLALKLLLGCADASGTMRLNFETRDSALEIVEFAQQNPLAAIIPIGDAAAPVAARAATMLGMPSHAPKAADCCLNKTKLRIRLEATGLKVMSLNDTQTDPAGAVQLISLMTDGRLRVFAVWENGQTRPRSLVSFGAEVRQQAANALAKMVRGLSLKHGPVLTSFADAGNGLSVVDVSVAYHLPAANQTLNFRIPLVDEDISLEEIIVRNALGLDISRIYLDSAH